MVPLVDFEFFDEVFMIMILKGEFFLCFSASEIMMNDNGQLYQ
jgi:hypothetical protein